MTASLKQIREALKAKFGLRKYRIMANGEIHAYGTMPNTSAEGWYLFGAVGKIDTMHRLDLA